MGRRSLWIAVAAMSAATAWVSGAPANGTTCGIAGARVVKETRAAVVVRQPIRGEWGSRYYGCLRSTGSPVLLAQEYETQDGSTYEVSERLSRLRGRFAAVAIAGCLAECGMEEVAVWDLRTGARLRRVAPRAGNVLRVMLSRGGALAYVDRFISRILVVKADAAGHAVVKRGSSRNLPPASVRLRGDRLSWEYKGERQSVRLR